jgi:hypothetical protein
VDSPTKQHRLTKEPCIIESINSIVGRPPQAPVQRSKSFWFANFSHSQRPSSFLEVVALTEEKRNPTPLSSLGGCKVRCTSNCLSGGGMCAVKKKPTIHFARNKRFRVQSWTLTEPRGSHWMRTSGMKYCMTWPASVQKHRQKSHV